MIDWLAELDEVWGVRCVSVLHLYNKHCRVLGTPGWVDPVVGCGVCGMRWGAQEAHDIGQSLQDKLEAQVRERLLAGPPPSPARSNRRIQYCSRPRCASGPRRRRRVDGVRLCAAKPVLTHTR